MREEGRERTEMREEGGGGRGRRGGEGRKGADQCCCTEVLIFIISAQQTSSLLHTSHDELTELPASISEEGGERVRGEGEKGNMHATENSAGL